MPQAVGVANGTDALVLVLDALGIGARRRGDLPGVHVLRDRRGDRPARRDAGLRRHRPADAQPRSRATCAARITPRTKAIMPVHLFGRPAPLAELAELGAAARSRTRRRRSARTGIAHAPASPRPSASSRRRTCSRSATAGSSPCTDDELAERMRMLRFHGSRDKKDFELRRLQLAPRRDPGGGAAPVPAAARRVERGAPRGGRALRGARPRRGLRAARPTSPATSTTCSSCARPSATASPRRSRPAGIASRVVLRDAAPPPARAALPRLRPRAIAARDRASRRARTSRCRCGPGSAADVQERVVAAVREAVSAARPSDEVPGQPAPDLAARGRRAC